MSLPKKKKLNSPLIIVITGSLLLHIVAGLVFGSFVLYTQFLKPNIAPEPPPQIQKIQPQKLQYNLEMKKQQQQSSKPRQPMIQVKAPTDIQLPDIQIDLPDISADISVNTGTTSGGLGSGMGDGGGVGLGNMAFNFLGLQAQGSKVLIVINGFALMLEDRKGGVAAFAKVKEEVVKLVSKLPTGMPYNVAFYAYTPEGKVGAMLFEPDKMLPYHPSQVERLKEWLEPVHKNDFTDFKGINHFLSEQVKRDMFGVSWEPPVDRVADGSIFAVQLAMEMKADTVFYIGPNFGWFGLVSPRLVYQEELDPRIEEYTNKEYKYGPEEHARFLEYVQKAKDEVAAINSGSGPKMVVGNWQGYVKEHYNIKGPLMPEASYSQLTDYLKVAYDYYYKGMTGMKPPAFYGIYFIGADEDEMDPIYVKEQEKLFKKLAHLFDGKMKLIEGFEELKRYASTGDEGE